MSSELLKIPKPIIFLRNRFVIKPGLERQFFEGQKELLRQARPKMTLVAAFGTRPVLEGAPARTKPADMLHLWRLEDERSLYELMFTFSENKWYLKELQSLQSEHQDLLVLTARGIHRKHRGTWTRANEPGYVYIYEELRVRGRTKLAFLRDMNWLAHQARSRGCDLTWLCTEITGTPSQVCVLWKAQTFTAFESFLAAMTYQPAFAERYAKMMLHLDHYSREYMHPESTEFLDDEQTRPQQPA